MAVGIGLAVIIYTLLRLIYKDRSKAAVLTSVILLFFTSYGAFFSLTDSLRIAGIQLWTHAFLIPWGIATLIFLGVIIWGTKVSLNGLSAILNYSAAAMVAMSVFTIAQYSLTAKPEITAKPIVATEAQQTKDAAVPSETRSSESKPDIYYIILDAYASEEGLNEFYGFDNSSFTSKLKKLGFAIPQNARSNYCLTYLSLSSSLNMEYINYLTKKVGENSKDYSVTTSLIKNNAVTKSLKKKGYTVVHFKSGWGPTDSTPNADIFYNGSLLNEVSMELVKGTMAGPILRSTALDDYRNRILYTFDKLKEVPEVKGPKFVFAHVVAPHPPYVFGENGEKPNGNSLRLGDPSDWSKRKRYQYVDQVKYINKLVIPTIEAIIADSKNPPIIIIQGDHATASSTGGVFRNRSETLMRERTGVLNAYYLPGAGKDALTADITPVNTFRLINRVYFGEKMELLPNRVQFSGYNKPFSFEDVTEIVDDGETRMEAVRAPKN